MAVPIAAPDYKKAVEQIKNAYSAGAEMLELRADYLEELSVELVRKLIHQCRNITVGGAAVIVTCRDKRQGGAGDYPLGFRTDVLTAAVDAGAEFIDFEYDNFLVPEERGKIEAALARSGRTRLILSSHNFETKFSDINELYHRILTAYPAAIPKLVYAAGHINDCFDGFDLLHCTAGERIVFCMGQAGLISRIISRKLGCLVTFASIDEQKATAPGQLTIGRFKKLYRYDSINSDTKLYGVIGSPVAHSAGPAVHNACFADIGANKLYLPLLVEGGSEQFEQFMNNILTRSWLGFAGFSVTIPHKQNALKYVLQKRGFVEPLAEKTGVANTILIDANGKLSAYNTDYAGALDVITSAINIRPTELRGLDVAVIGAGGVARAIVAGLSDAGAGIRIYNRTVKKAEKLAADFNCDFSSLDDLPEVKAKLLINCTSVGMYPNADATPFPKESLNRDMVVFDTVYNPAETLLLKQAGDVGARTINGLSMFVNQACRQFKLFTGREAKAELMRETITNELSCK